MQRGPPGSSEEVRESRAGVSVAEGEAEVESPDEPIDEPSEPPHRCPSAESKEASAKEAEERSGKEEVARGASAACAPTGCGRLESLLERAARAAARLSSLRRARRET